MLAPIQISSKLHDRSNFMYKQNRIISSFYHSLMIALNGVIMEMVYVTKTVPNLIPIVIKS